jgi:hypothetical protein
MNLKNRSIYAVVVAAACLSASTAVYAKTADTPLLTYVGFAKTKTIKFNLRNDSGAAMELKVGDNVMTLEAGKTLELKLPVGTRILTNAPTPTHQAGSLVAQVSNDLSDTTIAIR